MPEYTLYYFPVRGRAEISRLLFAAAGTKFNDERIKGEDWSKHKDSMPTKQMPVLAIDGKTKIVESITIARFLAKEFGLAGKDNLEQAFVDQIVDICCDIQTQFFKSHFEKDEQKKKELHEKLKDENVPRCFENLTKLMDMNGKKGFFVGDKLTLADLMVFDVFTNVYNNIPGFFDAEPKLAEHRKMVEAIPNIKKYVADRPKTEI